jgi:hypothetical protein
MYGPDVPDTLSFQGYLTDLGGTPVDGLKDITFKMYKGDVEIWSQTKTDVAVSNGVFDVMLGGGAGFLYSTPFDRPIEIGIAVDGDSEISPRTPLSPAAYALGVRGFYAIRSGGSAPGDVAMNVIGGSSNNYVADDVAGATIGGGGGQAGLPPEGVPDSVTGSWGTVGGGRLNRADQSATVGGGNSNKATGIRSTVGGGSANRAAGLEATVSGGRSNMAFADQATVSGGNENEANGQWATVGGGRTNSADGDDATVGGGADNEAEQNGSTIAGGNQNRTSGLVSTIAGGNVNWATGFASTIGGGGDNISGNSYATVAGGSSNIAGGTGSAVPGGTFNRAMGEYSFTAGYYAVADHEGSFVWNDRSSPGGNDSLFTTGANQFLIRAAGGVGINTDSPSNALHVVESVNGNAVLANHVAAIDNVSTGSSADVLALRVGRTDAPETTNAFISFRYNGETGAGFIRGNGSGGIEMTSSGSDYAEYLPHRDVSEVLQPGDVIGVFAGKVTRQTEGADQIMVVSTAPIVVGNHTALDGEEPEGFSRVAFVGQTPVKVRGVVHQGDLLIPSGLNDGTAIAVEPTRVTSQQVHQVFGTAWESSANAGVQSVNSAIGIDQIAAAAHVVSALQKRQNALEAQVDRLAERVTALESLSSN